MIEAVLAGADAGVDRGPGRDVHDLGRGAQARPQTLAPQRREVRQVTGIGPALDQLGVGTVEPDEEDASAQEGATPL